MYVYVTEIRNLDTNENEGFRIYRTWMNALRYGLEIVRDHDSILMPEHDNDLPRTEDELRDWLPSEERGYEMGGEVWDFNWGVRVSWADHSTEDDFPRMAIVHRVRVQ